MKADGAATWALEPEPIVALAEDLVADALKDLTAEECVE